MFKSEVLFWMFLVVFPARAEVLQSDLFLLSDSPLSQTAETDPYWDLAWHEKVAGYGDPDSQYFMGKIYEKGKVVPVNKSRAIDYYQMAAVQGHVESCLRLGELLPDEAEKWYKIAADQNDPFSQIKLSRFYEGEGDNEGAIYWMERAMRLMFPNTKDLTTVSPDLKRLKEKQ